MLQPRSLKGEAFNPDPGCRNMAAGGFGELYPPLKPLMWAPGEPGTWGKVDGGLLQPWEANI